MTCEGPRQSETNRLANLLGPLVRLVDAPAMALLVALPCWLVLAILSGRWLAAALCCWSVVLLAVALWLERPWLERLPFPPVTVLTLVGVMRWGLGAALLALAGPDLQPDVAPWSRALEPSQALWALVSTGIVLAALLNRPLLRRLRPGPLGASVRRRLAMLTLLLGLFSLGYVLVGVISGTLDRSGGNYVYWVTRLWRADTAFVPFIRLKDLFFLLVPITVQIALQPEPDGSGQPAALARGWGADRGAGLYSPNGQLAPDNRIPEQPHSALGSTGRRDRQGSSRSPSQPRQSRPDRP